MAKSIFQESLKLTGLPGATAGARYVGGTVAGAPTIGSFLVGDFIVDQTGTTWVCIAAGSPGVWNRTTNAGDSYDAYLYSLNPSAWYKLNDPSGTNYIADSSPNKISTLSAGGNSATLGSTAGPIPGNTAATYNGTSNITYGVTGPGFGTGSADWSMTGWVYPTGSAASIFATGAFGAVAGDAIFWSLGGSSPSYYPNLSFDGSDSWPVTSAVIPANTWSFVVFTFNRTTKVATCYVNGVYYGTRTMATNPVTTSNCFMGQLYGGFYGGSIAEIATFNYQLTAAQIQTLYGSANNPQVNLSVNENIAGKNFLINGGMDIWQRGTSFTSLSSAGSLTYGADRWGAFRSAGAAGINVSQVTSPGITGFQYAQRVQRASGNAAGNTLYITQTIETRNSIPLAGQSVSVSFWARAGSNFSSASNNLTCYGQWGTGTDENLYNGFAGLTTWLTSNSSLTTSWQRFTYTGVINSSSTEVGLQIGYIPTGTAGANDYFDITGVQLEIAPQATPFSRAGGSIGGELALCQRYYQRIAGNNNVTSVGTGFAISSASVGSVIPLETSMRAAPSPNYGGTIYLVGPTTSTTISSLNAIYAGANNPQSVYLTMNTSGSTGGQAIIIYTASGSANYVEFSSEL